MYGLYFPAPTHQASQSFGLGKMGRHGTHFPEIPFLRRKQLQTLPTLEEHIKLSSSLFVCQVARKQWWPGKTALWQASGRHEKGRSCSILIKWIIQTEFTLRFTDIESPTLQDKVHSFPSDVCFDVSHCICSPTPSRHFIFETSRERIVIY